jgi:Rab GTPase-binding effector protein 1
MQDETINLPTDVEELHLILLQYREDVIKSRIAKEHIEDSLKSEIHFLKDRISGEQESKDSVVQMLSREIGKAKSQIVEF